MADFIEGNKFDYNFLGKLDNIHDFYKGDRVDAEIKEYIRNQVERNFGVGTNSDMVDVIKSRTNNYVSSIANVEDQTIEYYENKFPTEMRSKSRKVIQYDDIIEGTVDLKKLNYIDIIDIEFKDGQSIATTSKDNLKKIGIFILNYMNNRDNITEYSPELTHFTFDGGSGIIKTIMYQVKNAINLIIPQNIADSASTNINHFGENRNYFFFPADDSDRSGGKKFNYNSNVLSPNIPLYITENTGGFNSKHKYNFRFNVGEKWIDYSDDIKQGPGVAYLANLMSLCQSNSKKEYNAISPATSAILKIDSLLLPKKDCATNNKLIFDIKRSGDWEQVYGAQLSHTTGSMNTVIATIDRLCILFSRMNKQPCILLASDETLRCYRFQQESHKLGAAARYIKDTIEETLLMLETLDESGKIPLLNFIQGRINHTTVTNITFKDGEQATTIISNKILSKIKERLVEVKTKIESNTINQEFYYFYKSVLTNALQLIITKEELIRNQPPDADAFNGEQEYSFVISANNKMSFVSRQVDFEIIDICNEIKEKFNKIVGLNELFKELDIRLDENGNYLEWGLHNNVKFIKPSLKKPGPIIYIYNDLIVFDKGLKTIKSYNGDNRRSSTIDYSDVLKEFFVSASKVNDVLSGEININKLFEFYGENVEINDKKTNNDSYITRAREAIENIKAVQIADKMDIQHGGNNDENTGLDILIRQCYWYILNEMASICQSYYSNKKDIDLVNILNRIEEILCNVETMLLDIKYTYHISILPNIESTYILQSLINIAIQIHDEIVKKMYENRNYSYRKIISIGANNKYFNTDLISLFNAELVLPTLNKYEYNCQFFLVLNDFFIPEEVDVYKMENGYYKNGYYKSDVKETLDKMGLKKIDDLSTEFLNGFIGSYNGIIKPEEIPKDDQLISRKRKDVFIKTGIETPENILEQPNRKEIKIGYGGNKGNVKKSRNKKKSRNSKKTRKMVNN